MSSINIKNTAPKTISDMVIAFATSAVSKLADKYGFDADEAAEFINISSISVKVGKEKEPKTLTPLFPLPWCGQVCSDWCQAIKKNRGLMTQCTALPKIGSTFCGPCEKAIVPQTGGPPLGIIADRLDAEWTDPDGKKPIKYAKVMAKLKIGDDLVTAEQVKEEAAKFGWVVPDEEFEVVLKTRKAKKEKAAVSSDDDDSTKKRGRPKKTKTITSGSAGDDLIASLVEAAHLNQVVEAEAKSEPEAEAKSEPEAEAEAEAEAKSEPEEVVVVVEKQTAKQAKEAAAKQAKEAKEQAKEAKEAAAKQAKEAKEAEKQAAKQSKGAVAKKTKKQPAKKTPEPEPEDDDLGLDTDSETEQAPPPKAAAAFEDDELSEEEECDDSTKVLKRQFNGKDYLIDNENKIYDVETNEEIGVWDAESESIEFF